MAIKLDNRAVNFVFVTDAHLATTPPGKRRDNYQEAILQKLQFVNSLTQKINGVCLFGGDFFHLKTGHRNSLGLLISCIRTLRAFPQGTLYGAVGNHDLAPGERMDSLPHQPLGLLIASGVYHDLTATPVLFANKDETVRVQVEAFPFAEQETTLSNLLRSGPRMPGCYRVGIVHAYGSPKPHSLWGVPTIGYDQLAALDFDLMLWGHDHSREETQTVGNITHVRLGSLARAALPTDEVERKIAAMVMSFMEDGIKLQEKTVPCKPLELAFATADRNMERVPKLDEITSFLAQADTAIAEIEGSDPRAMIKELCGTDAELRDLILELLCQ